MDEREKRDVREWSQTSDTRRRRPENNARKPVNRSGQSRQRMSEAGPGRNRRPARQSSRARRRRRNAVIRWFLFFSVDHNCNRRICYLEKIRFNE